MRAVTLFSNKSQAPSGLNMGDFMAIWDVARNKIIGISTMSIYYRQAKDKDLKLLIKRGVYQNINKHVNSIQEVLKNRGFDPPKEPNWESKFADDTHFTIPQAMLDDEEIAVSLREIIKLTLTLETEALRNSTDVDIRNLLTGILADDSNGFDMVLQLQIDKKWTDFPPIALSQ